MAQIAVNKIRRSERSQTTGWIEEFLQTTDVITISMVASGQPYAVVRNFVYDPKQQVLYLHGAPQGRTYEILSQHPMVCCTSHKMGRLLPAEKAMEFSVEYSGVTLFGKVNVVEEHNEAHSALGLLMRKYFPQYEAGVDYTPAPPEATKITAVYRIDIISWSGKENKKGDDFPHAFHFNPKIGKA